ncbi:hypothetical protein B0H12DRAFT_1242343 [Mycena haematopus]|nr:hypothetical protein B0H12DRAFT_1242343 [Mycena haematopus]
MHECRQVEIDIDDARATPGPSTPVLRSTSQFEAGSPPPRAVSISLHPNPQQRKRKQAHSSSRGPRSRLRRCSTQSTEHVDIPKFTACHIERRCSTRSTSVSIRPSQISPLEPASTKPMSTMFDAPAPCGVIPCSALRDSAARRSRGHRALSRTPPPHQPHRCTDLRLTPPPPDIGTPLTLRRHTALRNAPQRTQFPKVSTYWWYSLGFTKGMLMTPWKQWVDPLAALGCFTADLGASVSGCGGWEEGTSERIELQEREWRGSGRLNEEITGMTPASRAQGALCAGAEREAALLALSSPSPSPGAAAVAPLLHAPHPVSVAGSSTPLILIAPPPLPAPCAVLVTHHSVMWLGHRPWGLHGR